MTNSTNQKKDMTQINRIRSKQGNNQHKKNLRTLKGNTLKTYSQLNCKFKIKINIETVTKTFQLKKSYIELYREILPVSK